MIQSDSKDLDPRKPKVKSDQERFPHADLTGRTDPKLAKLRGLA